MAAGAVPGIAGASPFAGLPASTTGNAGSPAGSARSHPRHHAQRAREPLGRTVVRTVRKAVEVIPAFVWALIAVLAALSLLSAVVSSLIAGRARRLARQRADLLEDVGLLQSALLPQTPAQIPGAAASAAYRPAGGGAAGGDFYDVFALDDQRLGIVLGRVSASGRRALGVTALIRHVMRAYVEGGLQPRNALQVGADVLERHLGADYATVMLATYDRISSELSYAGAGMPPPVILGAAAFEPVTSCAAPPIGMGLTTGTRQTTLVLPTGAVACFFTDGVLDARLDGGRYGYRRAWRTMEELGPEADAEALLGRVATEADAVDDMAAVVVRVGEEAPAAMPDGQRRVEELELAGRNLDGERPRQFLRDCGVPTPRIPELLGELRESGQLMGGVVLRVRFGPGVPEAEAGLRTMDVLHVPSASDRESGTRV